MVRTARSGCSLRATAVQFGVSAGTVRFWVARAKGQRLDRACFDDCKPGGASNRTSVDLERRILALRASLRDHSVLGEYGPDAIRRVLQEEDAGIEPPSRATIHRVLARHGLLDDARRLRRPPPPKGWYLPDLAAGRAELDTFDFIEDLKIANGPLVDVLTGTSLHGALADAWIMSSATARGTIKALLERWRHEGLPTYAQFDNDTLFQGAHQFPDTVGRVTRLCLALGITPVFAPPREPGFQNAIEGFNGLWQSKVWQRFHFTDLPSLEDASARYIAAHRAKTARRREAAPERRPFPEDFELDLDASLSGTLIFLRRSDDQGQVHFLGRTFPVDRHWTHRLVRCEVDFKKHRVRFYALRRRAPATQDRLQELPYQRPDKPFQDK
ncbi:MAG: helix-turn-helix domain-containing protein [Acidobacteriota bacterium]|nr:helix-turn-helix domain-containing protein [Acidobacteriota bacterium]